MNGHATTPCRRTVTPRWGRGPPAGRTGQDFAVTLKSEGAGESGRPRLRQSVRHRRSGGCPVDPRFPGRTLVGNLWVDRTAGHGGGPPWNALAARRRSWGCPCVGGLPAQPGRGRRGPRMRPPRGLGVALGKHPRTDVLATALAPGPRDRRCELVGRSRGAATDPDIRRPRAAGPPRPDPRALRSG